MRCCLSYYVSLPSATNLEARSEGGFRVLDVLVLLVLELEETGLSPLLPFLFAAVWARGLDDVCPVIRPFLVGQGSVCRGFSSSLGSAFPVTGIDGL